MALCHLFHRPRYPYYCNPEGRKTLHYVASLNPSRIPGHHTNQACYKSGIVPAGYVLGVMLQPPAHFGVPLVPRSDIFPLFE
jgi:hypothetical protein